MYSRLTCESVCVLSMTLTSNVTVTLGVSDFVVQMTCYVTERRSSVVTCA